MVDEEVDPKNSDLENVGAGGRIEMKFFRAGPLGDGAGAGEFACGVEVFNEILRFFRGLRLSLRLEFAQAAISIRRLQNRVAGTEGIEKSEHPIPVVNYLYGLGTENHQHQKPDRRKE